MNLNADHNLYAYVIIVISNIFSCGDKHNCSNPVAPWDSGLEPHPMALVLATFLIDYIISQFGLEILPTKFYN